ncbi:hypothetical protein G9A89_001133 [Geosiphon pyriformis]|nr:hypothetical protein G9A89_001133 [Geosiphon pyriformis]
MPLDKRQENPSCNGFRLTSPMTEGSTFTNGQCYQVSFERGPSSVSKVTKIDLLDSGGNFVQRQWNGDIDTAQQNSTPFFVLNLGPQSLSGSYYLAVTTKTLDGNTCVKNSVIFTGIFDNFNSAFNGCLV